MQVQGSKLCTMHVHASAIFRNPAFIVLTFFHRHDIEEEEYFSLLIHLLHFLSLIQSPFLYLLPYT